MDLNEFIQAFQQEIQETSYYQDDTPSNVFFNEMIERMQNTYYVVDPALLPFYKEISRSKIMKFDAFGFDEIDNSLILISNEYNASSELLTLPQSEITQIASKMLNYVEESSDGTVFRYIDPSHDAYRLGKMIFDRFDDEDEKSGSIDKIKLFIITNKKLSSRVKNLKMDSFKDRKVELLILDIETIYENINSGRDKESIVLDLEILTKGNGLPYLKANFENSNDYDAYLCVVPGNLLSTIYYDYGPRLLESNVRTFLSNRGKINRGIRETIKNEPDKFFIYNNGIACTAKSIKISNDGQFITSIEDLQIINGGQTTASLTHASLKDKVPLDKINVPMKLTIIKSDEYNKMVQNISEYANSQNSIRPSDFFSNRPFHIKIEELSNRFPAPPKSSEGQNYSTYWFYERTRGLYETKQFKLTPAKIIEYKKKYPKNQVIRKEELGKYMMAGEYLRPDIVSRGSARNMSDFAKQIDALWEKDSNNINEVYFKKAVVYAIIFKTVDKIVNGAEWYEKGGYKLNIVPYTIAKIISSIPKGYSIDFIRIWKDQELYPSFINEINTVGQITNDYIKESKGMIVTEYAKRKETWENYKNIPHKLSTSFLNDLVELSVIENLSTSSKKDGIVVDTVNNESEIYRLAFTENGKYFDRLILQGKRKGILSFKDESILKTMTEITKPKPKVPTAMQFKAAWKIRKMLEENGVDV